MASRGTEIELRLRDELGKFRACNIKIAMTLTNLTPILRLNI